MYSIRQQGLLFVKDNRPENPLKKAGLPSGQVDLDCHTGVLEYPREGPDLSLVSIMAGKTKNIKKKKTSKVQGKDKQATAIHISTEDGAQHVVGIGDLRVMLLKTETYWYAQGMEIDYAVQGNSVEEAKERFSSGLYATIKEHLTMYGGITNLLVPAPKHIWDELIEAKSCIRSRYSQVGHHEMFPFEEITFYEVEAAVQ